MKCNKITIMKIMSFIKSSAAQYLFSPLLGLEKNIQYVIVIITEETGGYSKWLKSDTVQNSLNR